jgi:hypothetical protein
MNPGQPDVIDQLPAGGNPSEPQSGSYGDVVDLERLKSALPGQQPSEPAGVRAGPTRQPDVPISTPLTQTAPIGGIPSEQRIQLLEAWSRDPRMSQESRETIRGWLNRLIRSPQA